MLDGRRCTDMHVCCCRQGQSGISPWRNSCTQGQGRAEQGCTRRMSQLLRLRCATSSTGGVCCPGRQHVLHAQAVIKKGLEAPLAMQTQLISAPEQMQSATKHAGAAEVCAVSLGCLRCSLPESDPDNSVSTAASGSGAGMLSCECRCAFVQQLHQQHQAAAGAAGTGCCAAAAAGPGILVAALVKAVVSCMPARSPREPAHACSRSQSASAQP